MKIEGIKTSLVGVYSVTKVNKKANKAQTPQSDKLDISREAKEMAKSKNASQKKRLDEIRKRIAEGYYDREDVIREIAERMIQSTDLKDYIDKRRG